MGKNTILLLCIVGLLAFLFYPPVGGKSQIPIPPPQAAKNEEKKVIIEEQTGKLKQEVKELIKNINNLDAPRVVYRTKIKVITVRDSFYYPVLVDSMRFFDFATEIPDTVVVYKTDTVYLDQDRKGIFKFFRSKTKKHEVHKRVL